MQEQFAWFCVAPFPQLLVLFGFHNSLNTNPKRSGTPHFILTFEQLAWILSWFVQLLSHNSWFCLASTTRLIQIRNGAVHRISFLIRFSPGFVRLLQLDYTNPKKRSGTSDFILTCVQEQLSAIYGTRTSIESESR